MGALVNGWLMGVRMRVAVALLAALVASGCQTKQIQEMSYKEKQDLAGQIVLRCTEQGVKSDTPEMRACIASEVQRENYTRQKNQAQFNRGMAAMSAGFANASRSYSAAASRPTYGSTTVTCRRNPAPTGYSSVSCY